MPNPLLVSGILSPVANPGFTRLIGKDSPGEFVELNQLDIIPGTGPFQANHMADFPIAFESRFALSDYLPLPVTVPPPVGPIRRLIKEIPTRPLLTKYYGSDGTALTPTKDAQGNITSLSGTSADNQNFELTLVPSVEQGSGVTLGANAAWVFARIMITNGTADAPLIFGLGYCPFNNLFQVFLSCGTIQNTIRADIFNVANGGTAAQLTRLFTYHGDTYVTQQQQMPYAATDPGFYLPAVATLWPHLAGVEYFAPALAQIASQTAVPLLPALPAGTSPLEVFAAISFVPPVALATFNAKFPGLTGSALGPFAASFVAPNEAQVAGLQSAALWLGFALALGSGKQEFAQAGADFFKEINASVQGGGYQGSGFPIWKDPFDYDSKTGNLATK
jgi:hypothetical protein